MGRISLGIRMSFALNWIKDDWKSHKIRFGLEILAWVLSIGCSLGVAITVPTPPFLILYPIWIAGCAISAWACWTRGSFGLLANYALLTIIDLTGYIRLL